MSKDELTRRRMLGGAAAVVGGVALTACTSTPASSSGPGTTTGGAGAGGTLLGNGTLVPGTMPLKAGADKLGDGTLRLFEEDQMNFQALIGLGSSGVAAEAGEMITAINQANAAPGGATYQSFCDAFTAMGNQVTGWATDAANKGHSVSARAQFLRAAQYYNMVLFFVLGTDKPGEEEQVYKTMAVAFANAAALMTPAWERVSIPYEGSNLPGWFLSPGGTATKRPTVILNNGSDGQNVDLLVYGGEAALERGYNALMLEGPGQAEMLFERKVPFRYDWEKVITPVVDYLVKRPDVDPSKIALTGISMGGYMVTRAAAFENRLAAVVADPGVISPYFGFPKEIRELGEAGDQQTVNAIWKEDVIDNTNAVENFSLRKRLEIFSAEALEQARKGQIPTDWYGLNRTIKQFDNTSVLKQIQVPMLVTDYDLETFYPDQPKQVYDALTGKKKDYVIFTIPQGAQYHDAPMAPQRHNEVIFDWLDETLGL